MFGPSCHLALGSYRQSTEYASQVCIISEFYGVKLVVVSAQELTSQQYVTEKLTIQEIWIVE